MDGTLFRVCVSNVLLIVTGSARKQTNSASIFYSLTNQVTSSNEKVLHTSRARGTAIDCARRNICLFCVLIDVGAFPVNVHVSLSIRYNKQYLVVKRSVNS